MDGRVGAKSRNEVLDKIFKDLPESLEISKPRTVSSQMHPISLHHLNCSALSFYIPTIGQ